MQHLLEYVKIYKISIFCFYWIFFVQFKIGLNLLTQPFVQEEWKFEDFYAFGIASNQGNLTYFVQKFRTNIYDTYSSYLCKIAQNAKINSIIAIIQDKYSSSVINHPITFCLRENWNGCNVHIIFGSCYTENIILLFFTSIKWGKHFFKKVRNSVWQYCLSWKYAYMWKYGAIITKYDMDLAVAWSSQ
jgi:hypothetical protein